MSNELLELAAAAVTGTPGRLINATVLVDRQYLEYPTEFNLRDAERLVPCGV
jgi:hypothetical protein